MCLCIGPSIHACKRLFVCLCIDSSMHLFVRFSVHPSVYVSVNLSVCQCICMPNHLWSIPCASVKLCVCSSVCSSVCLSVSRAFTFQLSSQLFVSKPKSLWNRLSGPTPCQDSEIRLLHRRYDSPLLYGYGVGVVGGLVGG